MMFPLFSILRKERGFASTPSQFVLLHLKRRHLMEWVRAIVATTLSIPRHQALPPVLLQEESDSIWDQPGAPLGVGGPRVQGLGERLAARVEMYV